MSTQITPKDSNPSQMLLPQWMYRQIIHDPSVTAVWCFCKRPALTYCNGLQFVCHGGGHFGVPMKALKPRPEEQSFVERQCSIARELERAKHELGRPCNGKEPIMWRDTIKQERERRISAQTTRLADDLREAIADIDAHVNKKASLDLTFLRYVLDRALILVATIERMQKVLE